MTSQDESDTIGTVSGVVQDDVAAWLVGCETEPAWAPVWRELMTERAPVIGRDGELELNAKGEAKTRQRWRWQVALYIAYMATPKRDRQPESLEKLAELLGLTSAAAFRHWRQRDPGIDERIRKLPKELLCGHLADVYAAHVAVAMMPDVRATAERKLFFQMTGELDEKASVILTGPDEGPVAVHVEHGLADLSDEELGALERIAERFAQHSG